MNKKMCAGAIAAGLFAGGLVAVAPAEAATRYANCTQLHKKYKHGVGKPGARDKVRGATKPVTTFTRNLAVYNAQPKQLDRDKDGIACEKK